MRRLGGQEALTKLLAGLEAAGASLTVSATGLSPTRIGPEPDAAHVVFRDDVGLRALAQGVMASIMASSGRDRVPAGRVRAPFRLAARASPRSVKRLDPTPKGIPH